MDELAFISNMPIDEETQREMAHHAEDDKLSHAGFDARMNKVEGRMNSLEAKLGTKLSWPWFIGTMLTIGALQITMFGYLVSQIQTIQADQQETKVNLSQLNGKLEPFDFTTQR